MNTSVVLGIALVAVIIGGLGIYTVLIPPSPQPLLGDIHTHADFAVYLEGEQFDFSVAHYHSDKNNQVNPFVHVHDGDGGVIHHHIAGVTMKEFFNSISMDFTESCFVLDTGKGYCTIGEKELRMYVNGKQVPVNPGYVFNDLDQILISHGVHTDQSVKEQLDSVSDRSCIQSGTCPERGMPTDGDSCTTDGGCAAVK
jgi:hypothetical protein